MSHSRLGGQEGSGLSQVTYATDQRVGTLYYRKREAVKSRVVVTFRAGFYVRQHVVRGAARWRESHDSARTLAALAHKGGSALDQIQLSLATDRSKLQSATQVSIKT